MTSYMAKKAAGAVLKRELNKGGPWDPRYEFITDARGRKKRVLKTVPDSFSEKDRETLERVRKWARHLDLGHNVFGMRFGWAALIGALPAGGDLVTALLAVYVYYLCRQVDGGLDVKTKSKMKAWILIDASVGLVPVVGDLIDANIKCNARNCRLLEDFLAAKYSGQEPSQSVDPTPPPMLEAGTAGGRTPKQQQQQLLTPTPTAAMDQLQLSEPAPSLPQRRKQLAQ